jgi:hypothetical protein
MPNTPLVRILAGLALAHQPSGSRERCPCRPWQADRAEGGWGACLLDGLLEAVEKDLRASRNLAAGTALGLAGTHLSLSMRAAARPAARHVEWLAAHMRTAAKELTEGHFGEALQAVRLARLALRP